MDKEKLLEEMNKLKDKLGERYPARSYCHLDIFESFWKLYWTIEDNY
jgi:hypothetical protein